MANNPVGWFEIYVNDINRAKRFYESMLQVNLEKLPVADLEMWQFPMAMDSFGASGALVRMEGFPAGGSSTLVYFSCADCAVEAARIEPAGGKLQREEMSIGEYGFIALAIDTEGNMIGLHLMS